VILESVGLTGKYVLTLVAYVLVKRQMLKTQKSLTEISTVMSGLLDCGVDCGTDYGISNYGTTEGIWNMDK